MQKINFLTIHFSTIVITQQQPSNACDGLRTLINSSSIPSICDKEDCDFVNCSTGNWSLSLSFDDCGEDVTLSVTDDSWEIILSSGEYEQELNHTYNSRSGSIALTLNVVTYGQKMYYLLAINFPLFNFSFPATAIPVECPLGGKYLLTNLYVYIYFIMPVKSVF